jgi:lysophospholipase L1-like esterase
LHDFGTSNDASPHLLRTWISDAQPADKSLTMVDASKRFSGASLKIESDQMKKAVPVETVIRFLGLILCANLIGNGSQVHGQDTQKPVSETRVTSTEGFFKQKLLAAKRIVFLGDSNTHAGEYVCQIEAQLLAKFGNAPEVVNLGLPSETCSGLSEPAHPFPRPDVHERLSRALQKTRPDLAFACYGMNDGIYHPFDDSRFTAFQDGVKKIIEAHRKAKVPLVLLTPPPFDALPLRKSDSLVPATSNEFLWTKVYEHYDAEVMKKYADWMMTLNRTDNSDFLVIDVHTPISKYLTDRRKSDPEFAFSKDGVHFDNVGHQVLATAIFKGLQFAELAEPDNDLIDLVRQRQAISHAAWLTEVGHKRPGLQEGLAMPEAFLHMKPIDEKIKALLSSNSGNK